MWFARRGLAFVRAAPSDFAREMLLSRVWVTLLARNFVLFSALYDAQNGRECQAEAMMPRDSRCQ